jgi:hypothetical protein
VFLVSRLFRRALLLFGIYAAVLAAVVVEGFLGGALGIWAAILWGVEFSPGSPFTDASALLGLL